jgi:hypothetical protein
MARDSAADSAQEIDRLRKRRNLTGIVFFGSIAFMVLSCPGFCGLGWLIRNETIQMVFYGAALLAPFLGLGAMILMWSDRGRYGRSLELAHQAEELGLAYREQPARRQLGELREFQVFHDPTSEYSRNCLDGEYKRTPVLIMDYSCAWGRGRFAYVIAQTVFVFPDVLPEAPDLLLHPKGLLDKLTEAIGLGGRPIPVPDEKQLNKEYGLFSNAEKQATRLFTADVADVCLDEKKLVLEVSRGSLLVFWSETYVKPGELQDRLATALRLKRLLGGS